MFQSEQDWSIPVTSHSLPADSAQSSSRFGPILKITNPQCLIRWKIVAKRHGFLELDDDLRMANAEGDGNKMIICGFVLNSFGNC